MDGGVCPYGFLLYNVTMSQIKPVYHCLINILFKSQLFVLYVFHFNFPILRDVSNGEREY